MSTTVGRPLPRHSMYTSRPPMSTRPAKSLFLPSSFLPRVPLAGSLLSLGLEASAEAAAPSTTATIAVSNIIFLNTLPPRLEEGQEPSCAFRRRWLTTQRRQHTPVRGGAHRTS